MSNLTGTDKSVILLMTIGEDRAAEVFKHLSQREVQTLSAAMANVTQISNKQLTDVLAEFEQEAEQFAALNINANDYLRSVLVKALGEERAADILRDDLANRGPVRLSQVENEQKAILLIVRRLAETGEMVIGSGEDTYV
ncbi:flagellar motor switch protein FliG [Escherichia coli]|uniref:Flagellar motor switch protein FliG n=1 Tax=Escherichia coli TaxID=562 RepID=A0A2X1NXL0_ECOLX|nr:FliG C-terminal domain-containing protein [Escherichia coli]SPX21487.1 flagellar motor switch protein FliG [Escherichia coli]STM15336.1 flagellar motor switch protein FliG [Escherichia coli]